MADADRRAASRGFITFGYVEAPVDIRPATAPGGEPAPRFLDVPRVKAAAFPRDAAVRAAPTVGIVGFVERAEFDRFHVDEAYYLAPLDARSRAYSFIHALLRTTTDVSIAKVVLRSRQRMAAVLAYGPELTLGLLRRPHESAARARCGADPSALQSLKLRDADLTLAERLLDTLVDEWALERRRVAHRVGVPRTPVECGDRTESPRRLAPLSWMSRPGGREHNQEARLR